MTMLKSFDLVGNKQSFASWISDLSPCETPFTSMVGKEKIDQVQYSWQTDSLSKPQTPITANTDNTWSQEGSDATFAKRNSTTKHDNYTSILRKVVRVSDTTKKISLYGRDSELAYQMEKAGMEIKRDLEFMTLNEVRPGQIGTSAAAGHFTGFQGLVATVADPDTGAEVRKVVKYAAGANVVKFTQVQVFDLTYQLYLAGARANKVMIHPMHMHVFSDWIGSNAVTPHVHRMFEGLDTKYNAHVSKFRDPLGQEFTIIPNRYMPKNMMFFFNEADWTQMILRAPEKTELAKNGSSEKFMIEMEVGLRHKNPYASGILEFNQQNVPYVAAVTAKPGVIKADNTQESTVTAVVKKDTGAAGATTDQAGFTVSFVNDDGSVTADTTVAAANATVDGGVATVTTKVKHAKGARIKVKATADGGNAETHVDTYEPRG